MSQNARRAQNVLKAERTPDVAPFAWGQAPPPSEPLGPRRGRPAAVAAGYGLDEIMAEAEATIAEAQAEAARILAAARDAADGNRRALYDQALAEAKADLEAQGVGKSADELAALQRAFASAVSELREQVAQRFDDLEHRVVQTALEVAARVIGVELEARPELVIESVREALGKAGNGDLTIRVHPADMPYLQQALLDLQTGRATDDFINFEEDPRIERGGCVVAGPSGSVDAQPGSKLAQLRSLAE